MRHASVLFLVGALGWPPALSGQGSRWQLTPQLQAGMFIPTRDLGTRGVAQARMRQVPIVAASLELRRSGSPLGLYVASTQALQKGFRAWPTAACQTGCQSLTVAHGRFWTITGGAALRWDMGPVQVAGRLGGGLRTYALYGRLMTLGVPAPGAFSTGEFGRPSVDPAFHINLQLGRQVGRHTVFFGLDDFVAGSEYDRTFNDLVITVGVTIASPDRP